MLVGVAKMFTCSQLYLYTKYLVRFLSLIWYTGSKHDLKDDNQDSGSNNSAHYASANVDVLFASANHFNPLTYFYTRFGIDLKNFRPCGKLECSLLLTFHDSVSLVAP